MIGINIIKSRMRRGMLSRGLVGILVWILSAILILFLATAAAALIGGDEFVSAIVSDISSVIESFTKK
ncbi:MAG: hypothetical protein IKJ25_00350 [Clostridia bacterium]|nr:hypothetical protein [Clostridia bacterium]